jgi:hypothetical protein
MYILKEIIKKVIDIAYHYVKNESGIEFAF